MKKGFTLVELLAVIAIIAILILLIIPSIVGILNKNKKKAYDMQIDQFIVATKFYVSDNKDTISELQTVGGKYYVTLDMLNTEGYIETPIVNPLTGENFDSASVRVKVTKKTKGYSYGVLLAPPPLDESGANPPVLATGMIPVYWNGSAWAKADSTNVNVAYKWYDYENKQWANAVTVYSTNRATYLAAANGTVIPSTEIITYTVWIPRYGYQIATGYHTNTAGTINIKFLKGTTNTALDSTPIATIPTYSGSIQTNYIQHPAFTFGTDELTGMWVAKFEASGTTATVDSKPNKISLRSTTIGNIFTATRNMETNSRYGWGTSGTDIDTHLIKNTEWGAVAYLSKSIYGKETEEIWINPADFGVNFNTTGCAGDSASSVWTNGCLRTYETANGVKASTTDNIYGIYDMSGGAWEYNAAYVNNGNAKLTTYGNSIILANAKYKDVYPITTDSHINNYNNAISIKGDAVYETSSTSSGAMSWYADYSYMPYVDYPWFGRGGYFAHHTNAGAFHFNNFGGGGDSSCGFRFVIAVGAGL